MAFTVFSKKQPLKLRQAGITVGYVLFVAVLLLAASVVGLRIAQTELKAPQASSHFDAITTIGHAVQLKQATAALVHDAREKMPTVAWTGLSATALDPATGQYRLALTSGTTTFTSDLTVPAGWGVYAAQSAGYADTGIWGALRLIPYTSFSAYAYSPILSSAACTDLNFRLGNGDLSWMLEDYSSCDYRFKQRDSDEPPPLDYDRPCVVEHPPYIGEGHHSNLLDATGSETDMVCIKFSDGPRLLVSLSNQKR